jgi:hypothetical protein
MIKADRGAEGYEIAPDPVFRATSFFDSPFYIFGAGALANIGHGLALSELSKWLDAQFRHTVGTWFSK